MSPILSALPCPVCVSSAVSSQNSESEREECNRLRLRLRLRLPRCDVLRAMWVRIMAYRIVSYRIVFLLGKKKKNEYINKQTNGGDRQPGAGDSYRAAIMVAHSVTHSVPCNFTPACLHTAQDRQACRYCGMAPARRTVRPGSGRLSLSLSLWVRVVGRRTCPFRTIPHSQEHYALRAVGTTQYI